MLNNTTQLLAGHQSLLERIDQNLVEFRITTSVLVDLAILAWSKVHNDKVGRGKPIEGRIDCNLIRMTAFLVCSVFTVIQSVTEAVDLRPSLRICALGVFGDI